MEKDVIFLSNSVWPVVWYYIISTLIFFILLYGKVIVTKIKKRPLFVVYTIVVIFIASVQFALFAQGTKFAISFLHLNLDVDSYASIFWGALFYSISYLLAMPRNIYTRYI